MGRVPLAWKILSHDRVRMLWSIAGVAFGVVLMFMELGFMNGAYDSATLILEALDADLIMVNRLKQDVYPEKPFPRTRLVQARAVDGVASAHPLYLDIRASWRNQRNGRPHVIRVFAFEPDDPIWLHQGLRDGSRLLHAAESCLMDTAARDYYGDLKPGVVGALQGRRMRIAGTFELGADLGWDGLLVTSVANFVRYLHDPATGKSSADQVEFGVLKLESGADRERVLADLQRQLMDDVVVLDKASMITRVHDYWRLHQPVGAVFVTGMVVGFLIGVMICYQILFTEILDLMPQYATLKAIGYRNRFIVGTVFRQAIYLAAVAFLAGAVVAVVAFAGLEAISGLEMRLTPERIGLIFVLTLAMCLTSAALAVRKVLRSEPAELF